MKGYFGWLKKAILLSIMLCIFSASAGAADDFIPTTQDEIHDYAGEILREEIIDYFLAEYMNENTDSMSKEELSDAVNYYPEYPRRICDTAGNVITIVRPLERIVAYNFHAMGALDATDKVMGVANSALQDADVIPALSEKVNIGGGGPYEPDFEKILECSPDALLTYTELGPGSDFFEDRMPDGVPVIRLDFIRPETLVPDMEKLGYLINCTDSSNTYREWYDYWMSEIDRRLALIPEDEKVNVFIDVWSTSFTERNNERRTVSGATGDYGIYCTDANGLNVASGLTNPQGTVDIEWLVQKDPDVILGVVYSGGYDSDNIDDIKVQHDELILHPALQEVPAIKNDRIYSLSYRHTNGLTYPAARAQVAKWFYPEYFEDIDPSAIHQEYVTEFLGSSYNVKEHGVFTYPE